jgi:hypothetical protein
MMLELGIFCVILLAAGYWTALWWMGRHDDVLHGKFVHPDHEATDAVRPSPPFPRRPVPVAHIAEDAAEPVSSPALQSLLAAIQQDLRDVA